MRAARNIERVERLSLKEQMAVEEVRVERLQGYPNFEFDVVLLSKKAMRQDKQSMWLLVFATRPRSV